MYIIPGPTGKNLAEEIANELNLPQIVPVYKTFPDGETYLRISDNAPDQATIVQSCYNPQDTHLFQLFNLISTLKRLGTEKITAYVPYMCYARADRDILGGEAISIKTVLQLLELSGLDHLITLDIHNPEVFKYTDKMETTNIFPSISMGNYLRDNLDDVSELQVIAPDEGAEKRAIELAKELDIGYSSLKKNRDPETGDVNITVNNVEIDSKNIVIVDDIMATGSTLVEAASLFSMFEIHKIHILLSHAIGTDAVDKLREIGQGLVAATNSIPSMIGNISSTKDVVKVLNEKIMK